MDEKNLFRLYFVSNLKHLFIFLILGEHFEHRHEKVVNTTPEGIKIQGAPVKRKTNAEQKNREKIAKRAAKELQNGWYVNLGIGIPMLVPSFLPEGVSIQLHSENGILGLGPYPVPGEEDPDLINAGKVTKLIKISWRIINKKIRMHIVFLLIFFF